MKKQETMKRILGSLVTALALVWYMSTPVFAATTADVTVTATPSFIGISDNAASYDFGVVSVSTNYTISESYVGINNTSTVQTDHTISVTTANWTGGIDWAHSNTATAGADTVGLVSNNSTWGAGDVIVESDIGGTPNFIYENCPADVDYSYGLMLVAPTTFSDGVQKSVIVRVTAVAG